MARQSREDVQFLPEGPQSARVLVVPEDGLFRAGIRYSVKMAGQAIELYHLRPQYGPDRTLRQLILRQGRVIRRFAGIVVILHERAELTRDSADFDEHGVGRKLVDVLSHKLHRLFINLVHTSWGRNGIRHALAR